MSKKRKTNVLFCAAIVFFGLNLFGAGSSQADTENVERAKKPGKLARLCLKKATTKAQ
ncbi:MAG: hypothetical protein V1754_04230 [Pseudomonadota bacterium]